MGTPTTTSRSRPAMTATSPGYSTTLRVVAPTSHGATADLAGAISAAGGSVTALDVVESSADLLVVDVTGNAADADHVDRIAGAVEALEGVRVRKVSDRTFLLHLGGNLEVVPTVPLKHRDDLTRAYTPGVARVCRAIAEHPEDARRLTIKRNTVAVVTDGSAVLGLGNIGPAASMPVMEGKAALFKRFGGVDAWPVADDKNLDEHKQWIAGTTNPRDVQGSLAQVLAGADIFIEVSAPDLLTGDDGRPDHRVRAVQPRPGGRPLRRGPDGIHRRDRTIGLPEPDQQRPGVPRLLQGHARRRCPRDHRRHPAGRSRSHRRLCRRQRAERLLHRPVGLRPEGGPRRGGGGRPGKAGSRP